MKTIITLLFMAIMVAATDLKVDAKGSSIKFEATQLFFVSVEGSFSDFSGTVTVEGDKITAINGDVAVISLDTDNARRDDHLLSSDFFDEVNYKSIRFRSTKVTDGSVEAALTIKDITKTLTFKMKRIETGERGITIRLTGVVDRTAFDIDNNFMSAIIKDDIEVVATLAAH